MFEAELCTKDIEIKDSTSALQKLAVWREEVFKNEQVQCSVVTCMDEGIRQLVQECTCSVF